MKTVDTAKIWQHDKSYKKRIVGVDETGRGCIAGVLVCSACIMPLDSMIDGIFDSKQISSKNREILFKKIIEEAVDYNFSIIAVNEIEKYNILEATKKGMLDAINGINSEYDMILCDFVHGISFEKPFYNMTKGDATSYNIAAASIIAKVVRDNIMKEANDTYPQYNFAQNKGYGTKQHIESLLNHGMCALHRKSFVKTLIKNFEAKNKQIKFDFFINNF